MNFYQSTTKTVDAVGSWKHIEKNIDNIGSYVFKGSKSDIVRKFIGKYEPTSEFKSGLEKKKKIRISHYNTLQNKFIYDTIFVLEIKNDY